MPLPAGVTTCTVTYGKALGPLGGEGAIDATLTMDRKVVHAATGWSIHPVTERVSPAGPGQELVFQVPHVDQDGMIDASGAMVKNWKYILTGNIRFQGQTLSFKKEFQVFVGQTAIDLDLIPDGAAIPPATTSSVWVKDAQDAADAAAVSATAADASADAAASSATTAGTAKTAAETARTGAETARTGAEAARTAAETAATNAAGAATSASTSASTATTKAGEAATSATAAAGSATAAQTAETNAATAQTGAEAARTAAETARTGAETARTAAETAQAEAEAAAATATAPTEAQVDARIALQKATANGIAPLDADQRLPEANVPERLTEAGLNASIEARALTLMQRVEEIDWAGMWLADDLTGSDGDRVSAWESRQGLAAVQSVEASRPILARGKFGTRAAVVFDGATSAAERLLVTLPATLNSPYSVFVVGNFGDGNSQRMLAAATSAAGTTVYTLAGISAGGAHFTSTTAGALFGPGSHTERVSTLLATPGRYRVDGAEYTDGSALPSGVNVLSLGADANAAASGGLEGAIGFVGIKPGTFTDTEIELLEAWAVDYYGLATEDYPREENWSWWARPRAVSFGDRTYTVTTDRQTQNVITEYHGTDPRPVAKYIVGASGGPADDHNNGALVLSPGKPPVLFYCRHADPADPYMKYRVGSRPIEEGMAAQVWSAERTISYAAGPTYPSAHVGPDGTIHLICRDSLTYWTYTKATTWPNTAGTETWSTRRRFLQHTAQCHVASVIRQDGLAMRLAVGTHPSQGDEIVRYVQFNLSSGSITKSDGTVLGNMDGTNLPLQVTTTLETVATAPADGGTHYKWVYDVGDGTNPEIVWGSFRSADYPGTSKYRYSRLSGGVWSDKVIVAAGNRFSDSTQPYLGGAQIPRGTPGGVVYTARESSGTWIVEKQTTANNGDTWTPTELARSKSRLARVWPVESRDGTTPLIEAVGNLITRFTAFTDMQSTVVPVVPPATTVAQLETRLRALGVIT